MGIKVSGVDALIAQLSQIGQKAERGVADELRDGAKEIAELARMYAPVDEGNLEEAIKHEEDRTGVNGRIQTYVYVDGSMKGSNGNRVEDYAMEMHESPNYNLGPLSEAKQNRTGQVVGYKYLERAVDKLRPQITKRVADRIRKELK